MSLTIEAGIFLSTMAIILIFAVISNFLVIFIVIRNKKMRSVTNIFIGNLAVSDIVLGACILPMRLHDLSHADNFHEGEFMCRVINGFPILCITSSIFTLVAVSFERKQSIVHSLRPQLTITACRKLVIGMWIMAAGVAAPSFVEYNVITVTLSHNETMESCRSTFAPTYSVFNGLCVLLLAYVIPLITMWYNYVLIIRFVMKKTSTAKETPAIESVGNQNKTQTETNQEKFKNLSNGNLTTISTSESKASTSKLVSNQMAERTENPQKSVLMAKRMKIIQMLIIVVVLFAISWLPFFVSLVIAKLNGTDDSEDAKGSYNLLMIFLATFSTGYNVIVYVIFNPNFRRAILEIICCRRLRKNKVWVESKEASRKEYDKAHVSSINYNSNI